MSRILWIAAPRPDDLCIIAETIRAARAAGWEPIVSPASLGVPVTGCLELIDRLDPLTDAMLLLPHYISSHAALQEKDRAFVRGIEILLPLATPESIPRPTPCESAPTIGRSTTRLMIEIPAGVAAPGARRRSPARSGGGADE